MIPRSASVHEGGLRSSSLSFTTKLTGTRLGLKHTLSSQAWYSSAPVIVTVVIPASIF